MIKKLYEDRKKKYPLDAKYISILAKELGLKKTDEYKLFSIMGREELLDNLSRTDYHDFIHEGNYHDKHFRMNLHMHSVFSDGALSLEDYLEKGRIYADLTAKAVDDLDRIPALTLALTDHDEVRGLPHLLNLLIKDPEKYRNLRIILGCEFSYAYRSEEMFNHPFSSEILCYGINPFDEKINELLSNIKEARKDNLDEFIFELSKKFPFVKFDENEVNFVSDNIFKMQGTNLPFDIARYAMNKVVYPECYDEVYEICFKTFSMKEDSDEKIYTEVDEIFNLKTDHTLFGLPHPAKMEIKPRILKSGFTYECGQRSLNPAMEATWRIMSDLYERGIEFLETYYQSYEGDLLEAQNVIMPHNMNYHSNSNTEAWIMHFYNFANSHNLFKTGSYDTHGKNIYSKFY